jgi:hypothetical protein
MEDHLKDKNYNQDLAFHTYGPMIKFGNAITMLTSSYLVTPNKSVVRDVTTWNGVTEERCASGVVGPPLWLTGWKVNDELTPARGPKISQGR